MTQGISRNESMSEAMADDTRMFCSKRYRSDSGTNEEQNSLLGVELPASHVEREGRSS